MASCDLPQPAEKHIPQPADVDRAAKVVRWLSSHTHHPEIPWDYQLLELPGYKPLSVIIVFAGLRELAFRRRK